MFDFEEPDNPLPIPLNWVRAQHDPLVPRIRPGFPIWNGGEFDKSVARSGSASVKLPVRGGSASLLLKPGAMSVMPGADYRVTGWIRTENLQHARACITARLLNQDGNVVESTEVRTPLVSTDGQWTLVDLVVIGRDAAYLQLELQVLQSEHYQKRTFNFAELVTFQDVAGAAWFDDIMVIQMPRIELASNSTSQVVVYPKRPSIDVELRDLTGDELSIRIRVHDADGLLVDHVEFGFESGRSARSWEPAITLLGWYRVVVEVVDRDQRIVGTDSLDLVWILGPSMIVEGLSHESGQPIRSHLGGGGSSDRARFSIAVLHADAKTFERVGDVAIKSGNGSITLPAWPGTAEGESGTHLDQLLATVRTLRDKWLQVTLAIDRLPPRMAESLQLDSDAVISMFAQPIATWGAAMEPVLDRLGPFVHQWQIGAIGSEQAIARPDLAAILRTIEAEFRRLVPESELSIPWPAEVAERAGDLDDQRRKALLVATGVPESGLADLGSYWMRGQSSGNEERAMQIVLDCLDTDLVSARFAADNFARRAIEAWAALGPRTDSLDRRGGGLAIIEPWYWSTHRRPRLMPRAELAVWRNLIERLADRSGSTDIHIADGIRAVLLAPRNGAPNDRGSALAVWADPYTSGSGVIELLLGRGEMRIVDIFGNSSSLEPIEPTDTGLVFHRVAVTSSPIFIEGVDSNLVRFLSSLRLEPPLISARNTEHEHALLLRNPWGVPIRGELYVIEPGGYSSPEGTIDRTWRILPRVIPFSLNAFEEVHLPITIAFSPFEESGARQFIFDFELTTEQEYGLIRVAREFEIGVPELRMQTSYRYGPDPGGPHVFIDVDVLNTGPEQISFRVSSQAPGYPREAASVAHLAPGRSVRRTFVLPNGASTLVGSRVATSLTIPEDGTRLNQSTLID